MRLTIKNYIFKFKIQISYLTILNKNTKYVVVDCCDFCRFKWRKKNREMGIFLSLL